MALESAVGSIRPAALKQFGADADVTLGALAEAVRNGIAPRRDLFAGPAAGLDYHGKERAAHSFDH